MVTKLIAESEIREKRASLRDRIAEAKRLRNAHPQALAELDNFVADSLDPAVVLRVRRELYEDADAELGDDEMNGR